MLKAFTMGTKSWRFLNSWWILLTLFPFGLTSFLAFLYVGYTAKNHRWKIYGIFYLSILLVFFFAPTTDTWLAILILSWIISVIHSFKIRTAYLRYLQLLIFNRIKNGTKDSRKLDGNITERDNSKSFHERNKSMRAIFRLEPMTSNTEKKARSEIRKLIIANPNSLNFIKKNFEKTGELNHSILISFKEKVLLELRSPNNFSKFSDNKIEFFIEEEIKKHLKRNEFSRIGTMSSIFNRNKLKSFVRRFPSVTLFILVIIVMEVAANFWGNGSNDHNTALRFGAIQTGESAIDQWFRLASYIFVQMGGTLYLIVNLLGILVLAPPLERIYGSVKFPLLFMITGIIGGIFLLTSSLDTVLGGASVSLYGLIGLHVGLLIKRNRMVMSENKLAIWIIIIGIITFTFVTPSFTLPTYLGGVVSGIIFSILVKPQSFKRLSKTDWHSAIFQTVVATGTVFLLLVLPSYLTVFSGSFDKVAKTIEDGISKITLFEDAQVKTESISLNGSDQQIANEKKDIKQGKEIKEADENDYFVQASEFLNEGNPDLAIKELKRVSKESQRYVEAQDQIKTIERNLYFEHAMESDYKELQKRPGSYKGSIVHFYGRIYNIQENNGRTILTLSTNHDASYEDYYGDEALILFPNITNLNEGDYIHIYGEMTGSYAENQQTISEFFKKNSFSIYFDQRTFIEQAPVIKTKIIVDIHGSMYEEA
ncbi:rhomboid family intramembrane serine protease [Aquibacillus koreensis]|uniref:Rhomboid family intramembrane serine protease n=1 Tax=Aquibacillus koreensis TaxID=279446 RepID=A0A9X4AHD4_9BACI|nr:rhomboid family intramembrane serine protease [Aquibacillus koreensis]MCT2537156.1 rhomboid family intramembrane serine protease [Aquibacillus koreensis]MDC3419861.1 rhomboid family intramembrane serine protease [Aquibacillus koreensis]